MLTLEREVAVEPDASHLRARLGRAAGAGLFAVGLIGVFVPVLPTAPLWILALIVLGKSDPALSARIRAWPGVGAVVADFVDHGVLAPRAKTGALLGVSLSAAIVIALLPAGFALYAALGLMAVGAGYVATRPTHRAP